MVVGTCKVFLRIPWAESLKDKRMVIKSLMSRCKNKFNIAIAEISNQDEHKIAGLGFCCVSNETAHANSMVDTVLNYILNHCEAELEDSEIEILHL